MFPKPGAPQREEMSSIQVKNTALHLNGQNVRLAAKNDRVPKTPGLCLSAVGRLAASPPTQEATAQLDLSMLKSPRPDVAREAENQHVRGRPVKLAPLELPEEPSHIRRQTVPQTDTIAHNVHLLQIISLFPIHSTLSLYIACRFGDRADWTA
ncbi:hypothetical protein JOB18_039152 [Solea senegalensis]|uniref:Uncharacterized protein n=1 Tax=Solea senegalensis TaxID=28829 RepID=A0AAV6R6K3_SOLSE|nr:hypothetical protein JOB18_039152 [Solea senegalensis]